MPLLMKSDLGFACIQLGAQVPEGKSIGIAKMDWFSRHGAGAMACINSICSMLSTG